MHRRRFLQGVTLAGLAPTITLGQRNVTRRSDELLRIWTEENDRSVQAYLKQQNRDDSSPFFGGFPNRHRLYFVGSAAHRAKQMIAAYVNPASRYFCSEPVGKAITRASSFLLNMQHADGTIDLISTNFHSPPDTAFVVDPVATSLYLVRQKQPDKLMSFQRQVEHFLSQAGNALAVGGIHTPNHRWVVCRALARLHWLMPAPKYVERIDRWLMEGVDIDPDGQYTEQSVAVYTPLVNRCFITIARLLGRDELLEPVRKNLLMSRYYLHANGELVTEASDRQDRYRVALPTRYYYAYRYLAIRDDDSRFAGMARLIESVTGVRGLSRELSAFLEDPKLHQPLPDPTPAPTTYTKRFSHSGLVRIRRKRMDATILSANDRFFSFFKGQAVLQAVRFASAFFGKGQFVGDRVVENDAGYSLRQELTGPYYQPFPPDRIPGDGQWEKLPRNERRKSEVMTLSSQVTIVEQSGGFRLRFEVSGTEHVPLAIELAFRKGGKLNGVQQLDDDRYLLAAERGRYQSGNDTIEFGPGKADHSWTQLRGAYPKLDAMSVYITGLTPFRFELWIK